MLFLDLFRRLLHRGQLKSLLISPIHRLNKTVLELSYRIYGTDLGRRFLFYNFSFSCYTWKQEALQCTHRALPDFQRLNLLQQAQ